MKTKKLILLTFLILSLNTFASRGSGSRGGGHVVEVNGKPELVDLVTSATCEWRYGDEMLADNPYIKTVLKKLAAFDWYLANEFEREIEYLSWCFTGKLYNIPAGDDDSFVIQLTKGVQQAAFRLDGSAYIDQTIYNRLSNRSKAFLVFHEMMHTYLPMNTEMRQFKLMTLVKTLQRVDNGQIRSLRSLYLNLEKSDLDFPLTAAELAPYKAVVEFLASSLEDRYQLLLNSSNIDLIAESNLDDFKSYLSIYDQTHFETPMKALVSTTKDILLNGTMTEIETLLTKKLNSFSPVLVGYEIYDELAPIVQELIKSMTKPNDITSSIVDMIENAEFYINDNRLNVSEELVKLSAESARSVNTVTSLRAIYNFEELPYQVQALASTITRLAKSEDYSEIERLFSNNKTFVNAFKMISLKEKVQAITTPIEREKAIALEVIEDLRKGLSQTFMFELKKRLKRERYNKVKLLLKDIQ